MNLRICFAFFCLLHFANRLSAQNKILITHSPQKVVIDSTTDEGEARYYFHLDITVKNNTRDSIKSYHGNVSFNELRMTACKPPSWKYIEEIAINRLYTPARTLLLPGDTAKITLDVFIPACLKKGRNIITFNPSVTDMNDKEISVKPIKVIVIMKLDNLN